MVKKLKLDKEKMKQFLREKVELVGLGAAGAIAFLLFVIGLMAAFGASSPDRQIKKDNDQLQSALNSTSVPENPVGDKDKIQADATIWPNTRLDAYSLEPWYEPGAAGDPKRRNPPVRPIDTFSRDPQDASAVKWYCQATAVPGGYFKYSVNPRTGKIDAIVRKEDQASKKVALPAQFVRTEHVVLVEALFPFRDQVKDYLKALRVNTVEELQAQGLMPVFDGLNVIRGTVVELHPVPESAGEFVSPSWKVGVKLAPKGDKLQVSLKNLLKQAQEVNLQLLVQVEAGGPFVPVPPVTAKQPLAEAGAQGKDGKSGDSLVQVLDLQGVQGFAGKQIVGLQQLDWQPVYTHDKDGKVKISPPVENLLKTAVYDLTRIEQYIHILPPNGADTPFAKYVRDHFPDLKLDGVTLNQAETPAPENVAGGETQPTTPMPGELKVPTPKGPIPPNPGGFKGKGGLPGMPAERPEGGATIQQRPLKDYPKLFADRVQGKLNPFNVYGVDLPADAVKQSYPGYPGAAPGGVNPMGPGYPMGFQPGAGDKDVTGPGGFMRRPKLSTTPTEGGKAEKPATGLEALPEKLLIRFLDTGLEPGRTYQYYVQVRLKNPNFGKDKVKEVAQPAMAEKTHLESPFALTPPVYMPPDYAFYFVNQFPLATKFRGSSTINREPTIPPGRIPVQIHQLVQRSTLEDGKEVGDWVVAERLFLGRGDIIARPHLDVEVPVWNPIANAFELGSMERTKKVRNPKKVIPVDFGDETSPVLVDFRGGKIDEGNIEVLVLNGDGHLMVRHSYEDSDHDSQLGHERAERYEAWRARLVSIRDAATAAPVMPKLGPGPNN
jgi:hypothetical protein